MKFLFDTGAEHTILTKKDLLPLFPFQYVRPLQIVGADMSQNLVAHLVTGVDFSIGNLQATNQPLLVLDDDYFRFEEFTGVQIHGILGANIFRRFVVKINYQRKVLTLTEPNFFEPPDEKFQSIPLEISKNKPYIQAALYSNKKSGPTSAKLLIDTGASLALLLHTNSNPEIQLPENVISGNIGMGLGGFLEGYLGKVTTLKLGSYSFSEVITNFQDISPEMDTTLLNGRNGILGNQILDRFLVILDYHHEMIYLTPNKQYYKAFQYDRSGLVLIAGGPYLNEFTIQEIVEGSPADRAGLKKGDLIKTVNGWPTWIYSLEGISSLLKKKPGKSIKMVVKRDTMRKKVVFKLEDLF